MATVRTLTTRLAYAVDRTALVEYRRAAIRAARQVESIINQQHGLNSAMRRANRLSAAMTRQMEVYEKRVEAARIEMERMAAASRRVNPGGPRGESPDGRHGGHLMGTDWGIIGAFAGGAALFGSAIASDQMQSAVARIRLVVDDSQVPKTLKQIFGIAQGTGESVVDITDLFQRTQRSVRNREQALQLTDLITKAAVIGGGTAESRAQGIRQLSQSLASGEFSGDELRSIRENLPRIAAVIASAYSRQLGRDISVGELSDLSGKLGGLKVDPVMEELFRQTKLINEQFALMPKTFGRGVTVMLNAYKMFVFQLNKANGLSEGFYKLSKLIAENMTEIMKAIGFIAGTAGLKLIVFLMGKLRTGSLLWMASWAKAAAVFYAIWLIGQDILVWLRGGNSAFGEFYQWVADTFALLQPMVDMFANIAHHLGLSGGEMASLVSLLFAGFGVAYGIWRIFKGIRNTIIAIMGIKGIGALLGGKGKLSRRGKQIRDIYGKGRKGGKAMKLLKGVGAVRLLANPITAAVAAFLGVAESVAGYATYKGYLPINDPADHLSKSRAAFVQRIDEKYAPSAHMQADAASKQAQAAQMQLEAAKLNAQNKNSAITLDPIIVTATPLGPAEMSP